MNHGVSDKCGIKAILLEEDESSLLKIHTKFYFQCHQCFMFPCKGSDLCTFFALAHVKKKIKKKILK